jgi:DNA-binding MarR family transcriptional regulator
VLLLRAVPQTMVVIRDAVRAFAPSERTILHFRIATALLARPRTTSELAELTGASPATISKLVARLGAARVVTRRHDPADRRFVRIALTAKGRAQATSMLAAVRGEVEERLRRLDPAERRALAEGLTLLARRFDPVDPAAAKAARS